MQALRPCRQLACDEGSSHTTDQGAWSQRNLAAHEPWAEQSEAQVLELVDDAVCIRAWMQGADLIGCIALANAAVALQLAAESQQVWGPLSLHTSTSGMLHAVEPVCAQAGMRPRTISKADFLSPPCTTGGSERAPRGKFVQVAGHAQLHQHTAAYPQRSPAGERILVRATRGSACINFGRCQVSASQATIPSDEGLGACLQVSQQLPWLAGQIGLKELPRFAAYLARTALLMIHAQD